MVMSAQHAVIVKPGTEKISILAVQIV